MTKHGHFATFLLRGDQRVKLSAPDDSVWDLLLVVPVTLPRGRASFDLLGETLSPDGSCGHADVLVHLDQGVGSGHQTSLQLTSGSPVAISLSGSGAAAQVVFASSSRSRLIVDHLHRPLLFPADFSRTFLNKICDIWQKGRPFICFLRFLSARDESFFFDSSHSRVLAEMEDAMELAMRRMASSLLLQVVQYLELVDERISVGDRLRTIEGITLIQFLRLFPEHVETITAVCLASRNSIVLLAVLTHVAGLDPGVFTRLINVTGQEEHGAIWVLLSYVVRDAIEIGDRLIPLFERVVPIGRLQIMLSANKITPEAVGLAFQLAQPLHHQHRHQLEIQPNVAVERLPARPFLIVAGDNGWSHSIAARRNLAFGRGAEVAIAAERPMERCNFASGDRVTVKSQTQLPDQEHLQVVGIAIVAGVILVIMCLCGH
jgi:hypothetical protein